MKQDLVALCIMDGWGLSNKTTNNAVALAHTPNFDRMIAKYPNSTLTTHGNSVGLPEGCVGNSEVGHLHIGAGRTILMDMQRITSAIADGSFFNEESILKFAQKIASSNGRAHVAGLLTEVGVHALMGHLIAATQCLTQQGLPVAVHVFTDGRDSAPGIAENLCAKLEEKLPQRAQIETVCGRYWAMDRDQRWDRVRLAWNAIVMGHSQGKGETQFLDSFQWEESDEFIRPSARRQYQGIQNGDGIFFVNFRSDRTRQLVSAIVDPKFNSFDVSSRPQLSAALGMVPYFAEPKTWIGHVYSKPEIFNTLGAWVAAKGKRQFRLAETEKYPHVTYFLNGGKETPEKGEDRYMAQSPYVDTYDLAPKMAAEEVSKKFVEAVDNGYNLIVVNFANPDMVGHTGNLSAAIKACETVDEAIGAAEKAILNVGGVMIVTADHGNCEVMEEGGRPHTAHTTNLVPIILIGGQVNVQLRSGTLSDIAPTVLHLMDLNQPIEMTGNNLIVRQIE